MKKNLIAVFVVACVWCQSAIAQSTADYFKHSLSGRFLYESKVGPNSDSLIGHSVGFSFNYFYRPWRLQIPAIVAMHSGTNVATHSGMIVAMYSGARLPPSCRSEATLVLMT